ncbi:hypothetical protein HUU39_23480 [candidate division KSB1 bacterium]|nr:hypothetical protein [bacterium]NUM68195.1 hypothetical protein [candidate division KSB1 bacterium]
MVWFEMRLIVGGAGALCSVEEPAAIEIAAQTADNMQNFSVFWKLFAYPCAGREVAVASHRGSGGWCTSLTSLKSCGTKHGFRTSLALNGCVYSSSSMA